MTTALALVNDEKPARRGTIWREHPVSEEVIFKGTDECGRSGWFLRLTVTGLYPRRVGPYRTKGQALNVLEDFLGEVFGELYCALHNEMSNAQAYVIEGVPRLIGPSPALVREGT